MSKRIRNTFGIADCRTGKLYPDILDYHLEVVRISTNSLHKGSQLISCEDMPYDLMIDTKVKKELMSKGIATVIVSFQKRLTGNYAVARIYKGKQPTQQKETDHAA